MLCRHRAPYRLASSLLVDRLLFLPLVGLLLTAVAAPAGAFVPRDGEGWSVLNPSPDSRIIYVSTSGDDSNSGLAPDEPVRTLARASGLVRGNQPDWVLLNRGDVWTESFGQWTKSGRSASEPIVIGAYGNPDLSRPRLETGADNALTVWNESSGSVSNLVLTGMHFQADLTDSSKTNKGIYWHRPGQNLLIEDMHIEGYADNIVVQSVEVGNPFRNLQVRRSVVNDSFILTENDPVNRRSQGMYTRNVQGILIEENVFDHNGFRPGVDGADPTMYNHNVYISLDNEGLVVRNNILANAASHGLQARPGGIVERNLVIGNSIGMETRRSEAYFAENVLLHGSPRLLNDDLPRTWGIDMWNQAGAELFRNVFAHSERGHPLASVEGVISMENAVYQWGAHTWREDYPDQEATLALYDLLIGGEGSIESFLAGARNLSRENWDWNYTAEPAVQFFLDAFGVRTGGDVTGNSLVNLDDLRVLADNWQQSGGWDAGDFNYDGVIDERDLYILARNWTDETGRRTGIDPAEAMNMLNGLMVPEPGALALFALAVPALMRRRRPR